MTAECPIFTVFTPTYNRGHLLHRVYESLREQTYRDFEWLIVDDGSTDNTREIVAAWQREAPLSIRYFWQPNGHKKAAFNLGVREARGALFLTWDSDDAAAPHALDTFHRHWMAIADADRGRFVGVCALCVDLQGRVVGDTFPQDVLDSDSLEIRYRYRIHGEKWGFSRTDVLRRFPFPEHVEGLVPEGVVWNRIAREFRTRFVNEALRVYYPSEDSLTRSLVVAGGAARRAGGMQVYTADVLNGQLRWFWYAPADFCKAAIQYTRFSLHGCAAGTGSSARVAHPGARTLVFLMWPVGYALYRHDRRRARQARAGSGGWPRSSE